MNWKDLAVAEVHVLIRSMVFAAVPVVVMFLATGNVMSIETYALIVGVLVVLSNAVFAFFKLRDDGTIEQAMVLEDSLEPGDGDE